MRSQMCEPIYDLKYTLNILVICLFNTLHKLTNDTFVMETYPRRLYKVIFSKVPITKRDETNTFLHPVMACGFPLKNNRVVPVETDITYMRISLKYRPCCVSICDKPNTEVPR